MRFRDSTLLGHVWRAEGGDAASSQYEDKTAVKLGVYGEHHSLTGERQVSTLLTKIPTHFWRRRKENEQTQEVIFTPQCKKVDGFQVHSSN